MIIVFRFLCRSVPRPIQETGSYPARRRMTVSFQTQHRRVAGGKINKSDRQRVSGLSSCHLYRIDQCRIIRVSL
jgi:hypothetical protein